MGFTGYPIEQENRNYLKSVAIESPVLMMGELPVRVDPRKSPLATQGWLQVEDQGQIGSCQGNSLTECGEYCYTVATGKVIQLSRMYAYIASQMESNIRGDSGSTLEGGTKAFMKGVCTEALAKYPSSYPGWQYITQAMRDEATKYQLQSIVEIKSADHVKQFIGSGIGIVQIGINWNDYMSNPVNGFIEDFRPTRFDGGHAICLAGYVPDDDVGKKSSAGWWVLLKNSWSKRYGVGGYAYVDPRAIDKMIAHPNTSMYGRYDMKTPQVRQLPVDWTKESVLG